MNNYVQSHEAANWYHQHTIQALIRPLSTPDIEFEADKTCFNALPRFVKRELLKLARFVLSHNDEALDNTKDRSVVFPSLEHAQNFITLARSANNLKE